MPAAEDRGDVRHHGRDDHDPDFVIAGLFGSTQEVDDDFFDVAAVAAAAPRVRDSSPCGKRAF